eukprot:4117441-Karenia_brevis.AAC.1
MKTGNLGNPSLLPCALQPWATFESHNSHEAYLLAWRPCLYDRTGGAAPVRPQWSLGEEPIQAGYIPEEHGVTRR